MIKNDDRDIWKLFSERHHPVNEMVQEVSKGISLVNDLAEKGIKKLTGSDEENPDADTYGPRGLEPLPEAELNTEIGFDEEEEGCPNLERLIKGEEDAEGKETINVNDEADTFEEVEAHTYE